MEDKTTLIRINDKLGIAEALMKTANLAIANEEYFGSDGQKIAIVLDAISENLEECHRLLNSLIKDTTTK